MLKPNIKQICILLTIFKIKESKSQVALYLGHTLNYYRFTRLVPIHEVFIDK